MTQEGNPYKAPSSYTISVAPAFQKGLGVIQGCVPLGNTAVLSYVSSYKWDQSD